MYTILMDSLYQRAPTFITQPHSFHFSYNDCLNVLLTKDDPSFNRQMRTVVNKKDAMGNTPLHYATTAGKDVCLRVGENRVKTRLETRLCVTIRRHVRRDENPAKLAGFFNAKYFLCS